MIGAYLDQPEWSSHRHHGEAEQLNGEAQQHVEERQVDDVLSDEDGGNRTHAASMHRRLSVWALTSRPLEGWSVLNFRASPTQMGHLGCTQFVAINYCMAALV